MPIDMNGKTYAKHKDAVAALKRSKPEIKNPDAYVATIERAEKKSPKPSSTYSFDKIKDYLKK